MTAKLYVRSFASVFLLMGMQCMYAVPANTVIATIPVGVTPAGIAVTPNGAYAYVANNNNYGLLHGDSVSVLDLSNNTLLTTIYEQPLTATVFNQPYTVTINAAGTKAYVSNSNSTTITVIDTASNTITSTINGFDGPSGMVILPGTNTAYVNNYGGPQGLMSGNGHTLSIVNLISEMIVGTVNVDLAPAALAVSSDGAYVYSANYVDGNPGTGTVNVIRTSDNTLTTTITGFSGPFSIELTPDGKYAYVTNFGSNNFVPVGTTVSAINLATNTVVATINLDIQPSGLGITPDGRYAYASNYNTLYAGSMFTNLTAGQGTVNIIDIATNTVVPPVIAVGQSPADIAISPDGRFAYVTNYTSGAVDVIALQSFQISAQGCRIQNRYINGTDLVNRLTWTVSGSSLPVSYSIYRDAGLTNLVAEVSATEPFVYYDHHRSPNVIYTYYIVGTNSAGTTSVPVAVTVTQNCQ